MLTTTLRGLILVVALVVMAAPAEARSQEEIDIDLDLVAALAAYRDTPVQLEPGEYRRPTRRVKSEEAYLDDFSVKSGGHTLRRAYDGIKKNERRIAEMPSGIRVPIWKVSKTKWTEILTAVFMRVNASIMARHKAGDELFNGEHTMTTYAELKKAAAAAQKRLGTLSARDKAVQEAAKARHAAAMQASLPRSHNGFFGRWNTSWNGGSTKMFLSVSGRTVTGSYTHKGGQITGTLSKDGRTLTGTWYQSENKYSGKIKFTLSTDGSYFTGAYGYGRSTPGSTWNGTRYSK